MFHIKNMTADDFEFAIELTDTVNWRLTREDFQFALSLEQKGCFVLFHHSDRIGLVTTVNYGKTAWFGNLIVAEGFRKKNAGTQLAQHAVGYLTSRKADTIGLYAYMDKIPFYKKLGFTYDSDFTVLKGKGFTSEIKADLKKPKKNDIKDVIEFDRVCFGASRKKLLEPLLLDQANSCYVAVEKGHMIGYALAKRYDDTAELGPLVCRRDDNDTAADLVKACLNMLEGLEVYACVAASKKTIHRLLIDSGFAEEFRVARMFFKPNAVKDCIYMAESLERG